MADVVPLEMGPGGSHMGARAIVAVALYLILFSLLDLYGLVKIWPHPTPSGEPRTEAETTATPAPTVSPTPQTTAGATPPSSPTITQSPTTSTAVVEPSTVASPSPVPPANGKRALPEPEIISFFGGLIKANVYAERRLLLLVILAGTLGSLMHALRSLYWYTGNRMMMWSWVGFYLLLPISGAILSVIFYFVVRGGFFSPQASFGDTSPFGFAALSALVGLFSTPATLKLKQVAETIFTRPDSGSDAKTQGSSSQGSNGDTEKISKPAPTIESIDPNSGKATEKSGTIITGKGFANGVVVKFGGIAGEVTAFSDSAVEVVAPPAQRGGTVDVEVTNADGQTVILAQGFTYT